MAYQTTGSLPLCNADEYCQLDETQLVSPCTVATSVSVKALSQAYQVCTRISIPSTYKSNQVFADGIDDPEAKRYESNYYRCLFAADKESCTGTAVWSYPQSGPSFRELHLDT